MPLAGNATLRERSERSIDRCKWRLREQQDTMSIEHKRPHDVALLEVRLEPTCDRPVATNDAHRATRVRPPVDAGEHWVRPVVEDNLNRVAIAAEMGARLGAGVDEPLIIVGL